MACFLLLPNEIIELILSCEVLSCRDICRFASVCRAFNAVSESNNLWQIKYQQRWPDLAVLYSPFTKWKNEYMVRYQCKILTAQELDVLSAECYHLDNISRHSFLQIRKVCGSHPFGDNILVDELDRIIHGTDGQLNLTHTYYGKRALRFIRHNQLETIWRAFLSQPLSEISLIQGSCLVSQWCQPTLIHCTKDVPNQLNLIIQAVLKKVNQVSPRHPIFRHGILSPNKNLESSLWLPHECKVILKCISTVMFHDLKFLAKNEIFRHIDNTFIDKVLISRTGVSLILCIIYCSVASSLGVLCVPTSFPAQCIVKWKERIDQTTNDAYTFIDVSQNGCFKSYNELWDYNQPINPDLCNAITPNKVFIRMCKNLLDIGRHINGNSCHPYDIVCLCSALELLAIIDPDDMEHKILLARVYMHLRINMSEVITLLQEITAQDPASTGVVGYMYHSALSTLEALRLQHQNRNEKLQCRLDQVTFAVGMIMKHKKYGYRCVIYGWDQICNANKNWIKQMGVYDLPKQDKQPFYNVLVGDGTCRYAAQENLEIDDENLPVVHPEIGRYFQSYEGNHYIANKEKMREYPEDLATLQEILNIKTAVE